MDEKTSNTKSDGGVTIPVPNTPPPVQQTTPSFSAQFTENKAPTSDINNKESEFTPKTVVNAPPSEVKSPPSDAKIITEQTEHGTESIYASISRRYFASIVDGLIVGAVSIIFNFPQYVELFQKSLKTSAFGDYTIISNEGNIIFSVLTVVGWAFGFVYPIYFIGKSGATPGKALLKIKVVDRETNEEPGYIKAFLREYVGKFLSAIVFGLGYLSAFRDKEKRTWHDKIAGTVVVRI